MPPLDLRSLEKTGRSALMRALKSLLPPPPAPPAPPSDAAHILLLRVDRVGDMIVSTPAIHALRRKFPRARICVLASKGNAQILQGSPDVDEVWRLTPAGLLPLLWRLRATPWDAVCDLNSGPSLTSGVLTRLARTAVRISFEKRDAELFYGVRLPSDDKAHRADEAMKIARWLGADSTEPAYRVFPGPADEERAAAVLKALGWPDGRQWVAVHPGNIKKFETRWPEEKFAALCDALMRKDGVAVLLLKGPDEDPLIAAILRLMKARPPVAPALPLLATAALLKRMDLVVCNSTSTLHLAAAMDVPTLSFLSGYNIACWKPAGEKHRALDSGDWESCRSISIEAAFRAAEELL